MLTEVSPWRRALDVGAPDALEPLLAADAKLRTGDGDVAGRGPVARALGELVGAGGAEGRVVEFGDPGTVAVRNAGGEGRCVVVHAEFDDEGRAAAVTVQPVPTGPTPVGIADDNAAPVDLLGGPTRALGEGVVVNAFTAAKRVNKNWGNETWLHSDPLPFGFKVIRIRAGSRTSLQYHEEKAEVYFVLEGLAKLHYRTPDGHVTTAPFVHGTVATVQPMAWHRVEAVTDVTLIEASTYDDGTDNIRLEDDYGRPSGHIRTEHES